MPSRSTRPCPVWFDDLAVGDIIREKDGPMRIVREVKRNPDGSLWGVSLVIRRPSWTGRAYTVLCATDLKTRGFRRVPNVRAKIDKPEDALVARAIHQPVAERPYVLTARQVQGWP